MPLVFHKYLPLLVAMPCISPVHAADPVPSEITQAEAQAAAARVNALGSDQSLQSSTTKAMQALIQFSDSDIPGAVKSAVRAYGSFKTSEDLDRIRKRNILTKAGLGSSGTIYVSPEDGAFLNSRTSFRRLDPSFLNEGEASKISEEFEKKTGIKRKEFLEHLASASEAKLFVSDPKVVEKSQASFNDFVEKIPNEEFKAKVKSAVGLIPDLTKNQLLGTAVQKAVQLASKTMPPETELAYLDTTVIAVGPPNPNSQARNLAAAPAAAVVVAKVPENPADGKKDDDEIAPSVDLTSDQMARSFGRETGNPLMGSVVKAAMGEAHNDQETIFRIVSRKYRALTPRLK